MSAPETLISLAVTQGPAPIDAAIALGLEPRDFTDPHLAAVWHEIVFACHQGRIKAEMDARFAVIMPYDKAHPGADVMGRVLQGMDPFPPSIEALVHEIKRQAHQRAIWELGKRMHADASQEGYDALGSVSGYMDALVGLTATSKPDEPLDVLFERSIAKAGRAHEEGLPFPFRDLTMEFGATKKNELIGIFAAPSTGKTAMTLQWAQKIAVMAEHRVDVILLESGGDMSYNTDRMINTILGRDWIDRELTDAEKGRVRDAARMLKKNMHLTERPKTREQIISYCKHAAGEGSRAVFLDCLNHVKVEGEQGHGQFVNAMIAMGEARDAMEGKAVMIFAHHLDRDGKIRYAENDIKDWLDLGIKMTANEGRPGFVDFTCFKRRNGRGVGAKTSKFFDKPAQRFDEDRK